MMQRWQRLGAWALCSLVLLAHSAFFSVSHQDIVDDSLTRVDGAIVSERGPGGAFRENERGETLRGGVLTRQRERLASNLDEGVWQRVRSGSHLMTVDDTYISLVYARNLAQGDGFRMNTQLPEAVEGFTNFLWVLLQTPVFWFTDSPDAGYIYTVILCFLFAVLTLGATFLLAREILGREREWLAWLPSIVLALSGPFAYWAIAGLETTLFAFLVVLAAWLTIRHLTHPKRGLPLAVTLLALAMTRPEGVFVAGVLGVLVAIWRVWHRQKGQAWTSILRRQDVLALGVGAGLIALFVGLRWVLFGDVVPNTFHAKVADVGSTSSRAASYLLYTDSATAWLQIFPVFWLLPLALFGLAKHRTAWLLVGLIAAYVVAIAGLGGDNFRGFRFLVFIWPLMAVVAVVGMAQLLRRVEWRWGLLALSLATLIYSWLRDPVPILRPDDLKTWLVALAGLPWLILAVSLARTVLARRQSKRRPPASFWQTFHVSKGRVGFLSAAAVTLVLAVVALQSHWHLWYPLMMTDRIAYVGKSTGKLLLEKYGNEPGYEDFVVATNAAGAIPYYSGLDCLDMLGLNDPYIARQDTSEIDESRLLGIDTGGGHDKAWAWYVMNQMPDFVFLYNVVGVPMDPQGVFNAAWRPHYLADRQLVRSEVVRLRELYDPVLTGMYVDPDRQAWRQVELQDRSETTNPRHVFGIWGRPAGENDKGEVLFAYRDLGARLISLETFLQPYEATRRFGFRENSTILQTDDSVNVYFFRLKPEFQAQKRPQLPTTEDPAS